MKIQFESWKFASKSWMKASVGLVLAAWFVQALSSASVPLPTPQPQSAGARATGIVRFEPREESTLYRLDAASSLAEGCQPPCLCPILFTDDVFGTFVLSFQVTDQKGFDHYLMQDVNWVLGTRGQERRVTGSGEYVVGGKSAAGHQLRLDLSIDGAAATHFDSGFVPVDGPLPAFEISIAENGFYCLDRVFRIAASPVPADEVVPYSLGRAVYEEGCFPPCYCSLLARAAAGSFGLVDLGPASDPTSQHFALVDIAWHTVPAPAPPTQTFTGFGIYSVNTDTIEQRLVCDLTDLDGLTQTFDSALVAGSASFPTRIDVAISVHGFYCYDQGFLVHATP